VFISSWFESGQADQNLPRLLLESSGQYRAGRKDGEWKFAVMVEATFAGQQEARVAAARRPRLLSCVSL
jgi:hypothetical protein